MNTRILLTLVLAGMLLPLPSAAAAFAPAPTLAQATVKKAKKTKDGKKKNAKDKKKGKKGKKGKAEKEEASYESPSSGKALCADGADFFSAPVVKAAEGTKLTGAMYDHDILAKNQELALMMQGQGNNPMIEVQLERINNELRTKLAKAYMAQRSKKEAGEAPVLASGVAIIGADTILPAEEMATLMSSPKLVWDAPCTIHKAAAKGAALQVIYKVGDSYINTLLLSEDLKTIYAIGESISATEPVPAPGYTPISTK